MPVNYMWLLWVNFRKNRFFWPLLLAAFLVVNVSGQPRLSRICIARNAQDVVLNWDLLNDTCGEFVEIEILARQNAFSPFNTIATITNSAQSNFTHSGAAAITSGWTYQLVYRFLCGGTLHEGDTVAIDIIQPPDTDFDSVSYDPATGGIFLGWPPNSSPDIFGYYIWESNGANNTLFDSVFGSPGYLDLSKDPENAQLFYSITAFDSCLNQSLISIKHASPFLQATSVSCGRDVSLNWQPYVGHAVTSQLVYLSLNGGTYSLVATLAPGNNSYSFTINSGDNVEAYVRNVLSNGFTSRSNPVSLSALDTFALPTNYLSSISWRASNTFDVVGYFSQNPDFDSLILVEQLASGINLLWRGLSSTDPYPLSFSLTENTIHYLQQILVDRCGRRYFSNIAYNSVLDGVEGNGPDEYELFWNPIEYFAAGLDLQELRLGENPLEYSTWNIHAADIPDTTYLSMVTDDGLNRRCYQLYGYEKNPNPFGPSAEVRSNIKCFILSPVVHFPNAITINGANKEFKPVGIGIDPEKSSIQIFARNGQLVYNNNLSEFWDGLNEDGNPYPTNVFAYRAELYFFDGRKSVYSGNITVIQ